MPSLPHVVLHRYGAETIVSRGRYDRDHLSPSWLSGFTTRFMGFKITMMRISPMARPQGRGPATSLQTPDELEARTVPHLTKPA